MPRRHVTAVPFPASSARARLARGRKKLPLASHQLLAHRVLEWLLAAARQHVGIDAQRAERLQVWARAVWTQKSERSLRPRRAATTGAGPRKCIHPPTHSWSHN
eukprot:350849-Chlamydomonas_euryale.AAC.1